MTKFERIMKMNIKELAKFINHIHEKVDESGCHVLKDIEGETIMGKEVEEWLKEESTKTEGRYWKDRYENKYYNHLYECSVCEGKALYEFKVDDLGHEIEEQALTPFCPWCGVEMWTPNELEISWKVEDMEE